MSYETPPTQFRGKTWIVLVNAIVFGGLAGFSSVLGPFFLFGVIKPADGRPGTGAGIALSIISVPLLLVFILAVFHVLARRRPMLRICREGIEINILGASSLDDVPLVPVFLRLAWLIVSLQGFKRQLLRAPWEQFREARISGPPMARTLTIVASVDQSASRSKGEPAPTANDVSFGEAAFDRPLDQVVSAIQAYRRNVELRNRLPSWSG